MSETLERGPEDAAAASAEEGVGRELAQARRALGLSLDDVAQQLKYGVRQIEALEEGRFDVLHGATFARGMVRSYARLLKIDPGPLLKRIAERAARPDVIGGALSARRPVPFSDTSRRSNFTYVMLSLVTLAVGAVVAFEWHLERNAQRTFAAAAQAPLEPAPAGASGASAGGSPAIGTKPVATLAGKPALQPVTAAQGQIASAPGASAPESPAAASPSSSPAPSATGSPAAAPESTAAAAPESAPAIAPVGEPAAAQALRSVTLSFAEQSWVQVKDASGRKLLSQLNSPGTQQVVEGQAPLSLVIGNARHVQLTYDGQPIDLAPYTKVDVARLTLD